MNLRKIEETWGMARGLLLVTLILIALFAAVRGYCFNLEMDYCGPGSEYEASMDRYRDNDNQEAVDRCARDRDEGRESSQRDRDRADAYERDHGA